MKNNIKFFSYILILIFYIIFPAQKACATSTCNQSEFIQNTKFKDIIAIVNNEPITKYDFDMSKKIHEHNRVSLLCK